MRIATLFGIASRVQVDRSVGRNAFYNLSIYVTLTHHENIVLDIFRDGLKPTIDTPPRGYLQIFTPHMAPSRSRVRQMTEFTDVCTTTVVTIFPESRLLHNGCIIIGGSRRADDPVPDEKARPGSRIHGPGLIH